MPRKIEEWVSTTQRHADTLEGITGETAVVRELPAKPTERQSAGAHAVSQHAAAVVPGFKSLASSFTGLPDARSDHAFSDTRATALFSSLHAARNTWQGLEAELEGECFSAIMELGQRAHESTVAKAKAGEGTLIPTLLLSCNGLAAGDQDATYNRLMQHLKQQNAYAALLRPSNFQQGAGGAISHIMGQMSQGAASDDMHGLYQWYQDEVGPRATPATPAPPKQPPAPARTPAPATAPKGQRKLRERKTPALLPGQLLISDQFGAQRQANARRQLVVVLAGADQVPPLALQDLTAALLQDYVRFPVTLVLGLCRPASLFLSTLPLACCTRLAPSLRDLPPQNTRLEALVRGVLCGMPPCITLLSERPLLAVLQHYELQAGSAAGVMQALELAHTLHHAGQPLAAIAHAALTEAAAVACKAGAKESYELLDSSEEGDEEEGARACKVAAGVGVQDMATPARTRRPVEGNGGDAFTPGLLLRMGDLGVDSQRKAARRAGGAAAEMSSVVGGDEAQGPLERAVAGLPEDVVMHAVGQLEPQSAQLSVADLKASEEEGSAGDGVVQVTLGVAGSAPGRTKRVGRPAKHSDGEEVAVVKGKAAASKAASVAADGAAVTAGGTKVAASSRKGTAVADAGAVEHARARLVAGVREAVDVLARWRLGVLLCAAAAHATGAAQGRAEYRITALYCAAASRAFNKAIGRGRLSACQHLLSELCGPGALSVASLTCPMAMDNMLDELVQAVQQSEQWRPLPDVAQLLDDLSRLRAGEAPHQPAIEQDKEAAVGATPAPARTAARGDMGPSPTSIIRRGLEAAKIAGSPPQVARGTGQPVTTGTAAAKADAGIAANGTAGASSGQAAVSLQPPAQPAANARTGQPAAARGTTSNAARKQLLMQHIQAEAQVQLPVPAAPGGGQQAGSSRPAEAPEVVEELTPAGQVAAWLKATLQRLLERCPFEMPGASAFTFRDARALEDAYLMPQPRAALHDALLHPSRYLGAHCIDEATPLSTDIEVAYQRLAGRDSVAVSAWFQEFCEVQDMNPGDYLSQDAQAGQRRKAARGPAAQQASTRGGKGKRRVACDGSESEGAAVERVRSDSQLQQSVLLWAARFSQAAAELQHMGVVRANKRKRDKTMQVMFHASDMGGFV